ncbi:MAG: hypothetical protein AAFP86_14790, partial [Planctomycetota bacterium]
DPLASVANLLKVWEFVADRLPFRRRNDDVPSGTAPAPNVDRTAYGRRRTDGDLPRNRSAVFERINGELEQLPRSKRADYALLLFRVSNAQRYAETELEEALQDELRSNTLIGVLDQHFDQRTETRRVSFVVGLVGVTTADAAQTLRRVEERLLETVTSPGDLESGCVKRKSTEQSAIALYRDAKGELRATAVHA